MYDKPKIGSGQLFALLALSRIMYTMLYRTQNFSSGTPLMLGQVIATAIEILICLPVIIFSLRGISVADAFGTRFSRAVKGIYCIYFTLAFATLLCDFTRFIYSEFPGVASPLLAGAAVAVACSYCAHLGTEGLARAASVVFVIVILLVAAMTLLSDGRPNSLYLQPYTDADGANMIEYIAKELSANRWTVMLAVLSGNISAERKSGLKAGIGYMVFKLVFVECLVYAVTVILWRYVNIPGYPILALGAYAKTDLIRRFDSVNMFVWTLNCALTGGGYILCGTLPFDKKSVIGVGGVGLCLGLGLFGLGVSCDSGVIAWINIAFMVLLGTLLPLVALAESGRGK